MDFSVKCRLYREKERTWEEPVFAPVNVFELEFAAFAEACAKGEGRGPSIQEAAQVDCWIDACYESAREKRTVSFPENLG